MSKFLLNQLITLNLEGNKYEGRIRGFIVETYGMIEKKDKDGPYGVSLGTGKQYAIVANEDVYNTVIKKGADHGSDIREKKGGSRRKTGTRRGPRKY